MAPAAHLAPPAEKVCAVCKKAGDDLSLCNRCRGIYYCSKACQNSDWRVHKILCKIYADSAPPEAANAPGREYCRIIVFPGPEKVQPKVVWVPADHNAWLMEVLYPGLPAAGTSAFHEHFKNGYNRPYFSQIKPIAPEGQKYDHHLQYIRTSTTRHWPLLYGPFGNTTIGATLIAAGLPVNYNFIGPSAVLSRWSGHDEWSEVLIEGGPKLQNITMADFQASLRWLSTYGTDQSVLPSDMTNLTNEEYHLDDLRHRRLARPAWKAAMVSMDVNAMMGLLSREEEMKEYLREFWTKQQNQTKEA